MSHFRIEQALTEHQQAVARLTPLIPRIAELSERIRSALAAGGKILLMGNGGSAADCQHIAAELVGRYQRDRTGLAALALTTDTSILTSVGNDYGFERIFARQVEALARPGDVLVGLSTSGNSRNVIEAIRRGRELGVWTVGLLGGSGGALLTLCDLVLLMPADDTPRIQELHILVGHILCDLIEAE